MDLHIVFLDKDTKAILDLPFQNITRDEYLALLDKANYFRKAIFGEKDEKSYSFWTYVVDELKSM